MCWGRGSCPNSKCNQELIWTDGHKVTFQSNSRYQLNDNIKRGVVSLTISQARLEDAGTYCCRIEHAGWFNDEKINIRLTVENAPPTTTVRTTTSTTTTTLKTTQAPTTLKTTTPTPVKTSTEPIYLWTTSVEVTTHPSPSVANDTSPPPPPLPSTTVSPAGTTEGKDLTLRSSGSPAVTTENKSWEVKPTSNQTAGTSAVTGFMPDHELNATTELKDKDQDHPTPSQWPESLSPNSNGNSDMFQGNVTAPLKKDTSTIIIALSVSLLALIVICVILLQLKGQKRGRYLLGLDPHLELVTHAEESVTEGQAEEKGSEENRAKEDKAGTNHIGMSED